MVSRSRPGAVIHDADFAVERVVRMVKEHRVRTSDGKDIDIDCHTICVHGDTPEAVEIVRGMRAAIESEGIEIANLDAIV